MKRCGRSNSAARLACSWQRLLSSSRLIQSCRLTAAVACALSVITLSSPALPAAYSENSFSRPSSEPPVSTACEGVLLDSSADASCRPPEAALLAFEPGEQDTNAPATTTEIPPAVPGTTPVDSQSSPGDAAAPVQQTGTADYDDGIIRYEHAKNGEISGPPVGSLDDFMSEGDITSPLGFEVREDKRRVKKGAEAQGLLIMEVFAGTPAARAGLHPYHRAVRDVLETAAVAGAMFVPPVVLLVPVFDQVRVGESYDLIIGVDGSRVTNFLDFQDRLRDVQPGEIVYFSIIRNGERMQIPVPVPENFTNPPF